MLRNHQKIQYVSSLYCYQRWFCIINVYDCFCFFVFYAPNILGHADNYIEADPLVTPAHIVPEWYLLPFYDLEISS